MSKAAGISRSEPLRHALQRGVYGVGRYHATQFCSHLGLRPSAKLGDMHPERQEWVLERWRSFLESEELPVNDPLRGIEKAASDRLVSIGSWRGIRNLKGLPVRGQNTKSNARTQRKRRQSSAKVGGIWAGANKTGKGMHTLACSRPAGLLAAL